MRSYPGKLWIAGEGGDGLDVIVDVDESRIAIRTATLRYLLPGSVAAAYPAKTLGEWPRADVGTVRLSASRFRLTIGQDLVEFEPSMVPADFARSIGAQARHPARKLPRA